MTLPRHAFFRGRIVPYAEARVGVLTHALNYGTGVFAGIRAGTGPRRRKALSCSGPGNTEAASSSRPGSST